jgi:hypothetical protein
MRKKQMTIEDLPEDFKQYKMVLSNGSSYIINGETKKNILNSRHNFIELKNGTVINKSFIVEISLSIEETKDFYYKNKEKLVLPEKL